MTPVEPDAAVAAPADQVTEGLGHNGGRTGTGRRVPVASADAYETLRQEVLRAIRDRKVDLSEEERVRQLVREHVNAYQTQAKSGLGGRALADVEAMVNRLWTSIYEYGPLTPLLMGKEVYEEIFVRGGDVGYIDHDGRLAMLDEPVDEIEVRSHIEKLLGEAGIAVDETQPMVQGQVLNGRARLSAVIPPISDRLDVTIRRYVLRRESFPELVEWGAIDTAAASLLTACMQIPTGILVTGQPGSGKTSLVNAILRAAPPALRVICCEDTPELQVGHLNASQWRTRPSRPDGTGEVGLRDLVRQALGMRPDVIVVGEVRGAEAYELTRAGNAGCGMISTVHANGAREGLQALASTAIMAGQNVPADQVRAVFSAIVDLVVHLDREPIALKRQGEGRIRRQVMEIAAVPSVQSVHGDFAVEPLFVRQEFDAPLRWTGAPLPEPLTVRLDRALKHRGVTVQQLLDGTKSLVDSVGGQ